MVKAQVWQASEPFRPRSVQFHGLRMVADWRLKLYSIVYGDAPPDWEIFEPGLALAFAQLPQPAITTQRPGVGFVIAHQGRGVYFLVLNWWDNENEYFNRVFTRSFGQQAEWQLATAGETACVWDLEVIWFEREAYVETVLAQTNGADLEAYLTRSM